MVNRAFVHHHDAVSTGEGAQFRSLGQLVLCVPSACEEWMYNILMKKMNEMFFVD